MSGLSMQMLEELAFIGLVVEGFFYGIYSAIFAMYFHHQFSEKCTDKRPTIIFYSICTLYVLSLALVAIDIEAILIIYTLPQDRFILAITADTMSGFCDSIAQSILIYRCWIVWNRNTRVVIVPAILAFGFLALWLASIGSEILDRSQGQILEAPKWGYLTTLTSLALSLAVNALVTGLIIFKIVKVYCEVKPLYGQTLGNTSGSKLRPIIFIIIESGLALFCIQLSYLVVAIFQTQNTIVATQFIICIQQGITPTIIQVRVSMGLSFHDNESMVEVASGLRFGPVDDHQNSIPEADNAITDHREDEVEDIGVQPCHESDQQEIDRDNDIGIRQSNELDITEVQREEYIYTASSP